MIAVMANGKANLKLVVHFVMHPGTLVAMCMQLA